MRTARTFSGQRMFGIVSRSIGCWKYNDCFAARNPGIMRNSLFLMLCSGLVLNGCSSTPKHQGVYVDANAPEPSPMSRKIALDHETEERVLALNPENVTSDDVRDVLSNAPAPSIINIHGGILPVQGYLVSFSQFLAGMGYPETSIRNPRD